MPEPQARLQLAAQSIAENDPDRDGLVADEVFAGLVERERLGSTGLGFGLQYPTAEWPANPFMPPSCP